MQHWNSNDEACSTGTQLPPIQHCREWFERAAQQHVAGLLDRLEVCQRHRHRRSCLNPAETVLPIDDGNGEQTGELPEVEGGERRGIDGRRAPTPEAFGVGKAAQRVEQRGVGLYSLAVRSARAGVRAPRIARRFPPDVRLAQRHDGKPKKDR